MIKTLNVKIGYGTSTGYSSSSDFKSSRCSPQVAALAALAELMLIADRGSFLEAFMDHAEQTSRDIAASYAEAAVAS